MNKSFNFPHVFNYQNLYAITVREEEIIENGCIDASCFFSKMPSEISWLNNIFQCLSIGKKVQISSRTPFLFQCFPPLQLLSVLLLHIVLAYVKAKYLWDKKFFGAYAQRKMFQDI